MAKKEDTIAEFRCQNCKSGSTYVKKGLTESQKIRCCRRCGHEEKIKIFGTRKNSIK
jgi:hypothetical protein